MKHSSYHGELVIKSTTKNNISVCGYASVFDVIDSHNDIILRGAFENISQKSNIIKFLWQHDHKKPIGVITSLKEDDYGLYVECSINHMTQQGKEAISLLEQGALNGLSIGFIPKEANYNQQGQREIKSASLHEISLVTFPANAEAQINRINSVLSRASIAISTLNQQ